MSRIFLVGMPGVGKTYWGRVLAERFGFTFADLDECIEQTERRTIHKIFETEGEPYFRKRETECLEQLCLRVNTIVACGGGTPAFNGNMRLMKEQGCVVYLTADINTILTRVEQDRGARPLLGTEDINQKLENLYKERKPYYEQADYTLQIDEEIIANFEQIIALCTNRH